MNDELTMRLAMIKRYCNVDANALHSLLVDITERAKGVTQFAASHFQPTLLPATAWVSPLHPPAALPLKDGES